MKDKEKRTKNLIMYFGLLLILFIIGVLCFSFKDDGEIKYNNPRNMAIDYVESMIKGDYARAFKYIYLPQDAFVNKSDFEEYVNNHVSYKDIKGKKISEVIDNEDGTYKISVIDDKGNINRFELSILDRTVNDYRIDESDIFISDYVMNIPSNTDLYIDGVLVDKSMITRKSNSEDMYALSAIASTNKKIKLYNKLSEKEIEWTPSSENDGTHFKLELNNDELKNKAYAFIKNTWNAMYSEYNKGSKMSEVKKYFDEDVMDSEIKLYYKTGFDKMKKGRTNIGEYNNYKFTKIIDNKNDPNMVLSDELIKLNFGYTLTWRWKYRGANSAVRMSMNRYSSVTLKVKDESFVIHDIEDSGLFNYASQYTRDF